MMEFIKATLGRFRRDEKGVTLVEYGIALALAVGLGTAALGSLGDEVGDAMTAAGNEMPSSTTSP